MTKETQAAKHTIRVILADDHAIVRAGIRQFLEQSSNIQVIAEASDGEIAIETIGNLLPDVAIIDIQMPKRTGIEVAKTVRNNRWPVGILVLTSYDDDPYIAALLKTGANGYILKTSSPQEIIKAVHDVYEGKSVLDAAILPKVLSHFNHNGLQTDFEDLTERETEILSLVAKGLTNKVIGCKLQISDRTVQGHIARIFEKMQVSNRTEAVMKGISWCIIPPPEGTTTTSLSFENSY
jgi:DNA-binding NarL/FixJ family response regulator